MSPFLAEIRIFPFNFPPKGWAFCHGQLMPISQNTALFALLGTTYGGDGKSTFALPDLQGSAPLQPGQGQGLSLYDLGEMGGTDYVTLLQSELPVHTHSLNPDAPVSADTATPSPAASFAQSTGGTLYQQTATNGEYLAPTALGTSGGSLPHNNMQPYLTLNFCIALQGVFPQRP
jgi:microcystin-dependent protein